MRTIGLTFPVEAVQQPASAVATSLASANQQLTFKLPETTERDDQASEIPRTVSLTPSSSLSRSSNLSPTGEALAQMPRKPEVEALPRPLPAFEEVLRPIARKTSVRAVVKGQRGPTVVCRVELLRAAKAAQGLTDQQIGDLIGCDRRTVASALEADPSTKLYTFCALVQVLGLEMAEVFPYSSQRKVVNAQKIWSGGPYDNTKELTRLFQEEKAAHRTRRRFRRND